MAPDLVNFIALVALGVPAVAFLALAFSMLLPRPLPERRVLQLTAWAFSAALLATLALAVGRLTGQIATPEVDLGPLFALRSYHFAVHFLLDGPALLMLTLDYALCGLIGAFSARYLHQDPGYARFYLLLLLFANGVALVGSAAGLDLLFAGWELLGLTSALLVAFFHRRVGPVANALRVYAVYRVTDIGLLVALVALHHRLGSVAFSDLGGVPVGAQGLGLVAAALVFGAMGKGAMVPFTGWLPRAMEGPTPSSAIFYGALSVHASPFLLLRVAPLLDAHPGARIGLVVVGLVTAAHASMVGRAQTDVKTSLGYASVAQVALIWIEIGLGLHTLAFVHIGGHAVLRTWQLLRAPSQLHDRHHLARALGAGTPAHSAAAPARVGALGLAAYRWAIERWYLDEALAGLVRVLFAPLRMLDRLDALLVRVVEGEAEPEEEAAMLVPEEGVYVR